MVFIGIRVKRKVQKRLLIKPMETVSWRYQRPVTFSQNDIGKVLSISRKFYNNGLKPEIDGQIVEFFSKNKSYNNQIQAEQWSECLNANHEVIRTTKGLPLIKNVFKNIRLK